MKKGVYLIFAVFILYSSCKKKEDPIVLDLDALVRNMTQAPSGGSETYTYDGEGRVTQVDRSNGTNTTIVYSGDTVVETTYSDTGSVAGVKTVFLDTSGLALNSYQADGSGNFVSYTTYTYNDSRCKTGEKTYDINNSLIVNRQISVIGDDIFYATVNDVLTPENNAEFAYTYNYDLTNTTGNKNLGRTYYGESPSHMPITLKKTSSTTGNAYYTFQYTVDGSGRISSQTAYNHQGQLVYTNNYTY